MAGTCELEEHRCCRDCLQTGHARSTRMTFTEIAWRSSVCLQFGFGFTLAVPTMYQPQPVFKNDRCIWSRRGLTFQTGLNQSECSGVGRFMIVVCARRSLVAFRLQSASRDVPSRSSRKRWCSYRFIERAIDTGSVSTCSRGMFMRKFARHAFHFRSLAVFLCKHNSCTLNAGAARHSERRRGRLEV